MPRLTVRQPNTDFPLSNVRVLTLTPDDFLGCKACFEGRHGDPVPTSSGRVVCLCCSMTIPASSTSQRYEGACS
jgi:hypothetical protein